MPKSRLGVEIFMTKNDIFKNNVELCILSTGGTIEKTYNEENGSLINLNSRLKDILMNRMRLPYTKIKFRSILAKDSLQMIMSDREFILEEALKETHDLTPLVILHGTDTLCVTAELFYNQIKKPLVPIIFTGAMKPMGFIDSDAPQNVTEAILCARILEAGIYVSFHGRVFKLPNVRKNKKKGTFESFEAIELLELAGTNNE